MPSRPTTPSARHIELCRMMMCRRRTVKVVLYERFCLVSGPHSLDGGASWTGGHTETAVCRAICHVRVFDTAGLRKKLCVRERLWDGFSRFMLFREQCWSGGGSTPSLSHVSCIDPANGPIPSRTGKRTATVCTACAQRTLHSQNDASHMQGVKPGKLQKIDCIFINILRNRAAIFTPGDPPPPRLRSDKHEPQGLSARGRTMLRPPSDRQT